MRALCAAHNVGPGIFHLETDPLFFILGLTCCGPLPDALWPGCHPEEALGAQRGRQGGFLKDSVPQARWMEWPVRSARVCDSQESVTVSTNRPDKYP